MSSLCKYISLQYKQHITETINPMLIHCRKSTLKSSHRAPPKRGSTTGLITLLFTILITLSACSSVVRTDAPTISHVHIGHALTGWFDTPNKVGLLVTAEQEATIAAANAALMIEAAVKGDLPTTKKLLGNIGNALDPETYPDGNGKGYGLRKATNGAISHLKFAADSPDASNNTLRSVARTSIVANSALEKTDEALILVEEALKIDDLDVLAELGRELLILTNDIAGGPDKSTPDAYGLFEFRSDIEAMVDREDPPYTTVESFYLFNLIRLPDGGWAFGKGNRRRSGGTSY